MVTEKAVDIVDIISNIANIASNMGRRGGAVVAGNTTTARPGAIAKLVDIAVQIWRESGGGLKDETDLLQGLFADMALKNAKLEHDEQHKIAALFKHLEPHEKLVLRVATSQMEPVTEKVVIPGKTVKRDGKEVRDPETVKYEKTGVDPRVNTLKGIALLIENDLSNVAEVAQMLRDTSALGSQNKAVKAYLWCKAELEKEALRTFRVEKLSDITYKMIEHKFFAPEDPAERPVVYTLNPIKLFVNICTPGPTVKVILGSKPKAPRDAAPIRRSRR